MTRTFTYHSALLGNIFIGDHFNNRVRKVDASTRIITTIAGTGIGSYNGDGGQATSANLYTAIGVAVDASGNVYVCDNDNNRIRKVTKSTGIITTIAGTGVAGYSGDGGPATAATVMENHGINVDNAGNVYFGDNTGYNVIRKITVSTGIIITVAGNGGTGFNGDNIQATAASLNSPTDVVFDNFGNLYITDATNNRVRKVDVSTGVITTIVGTGATSSTGDGSAASSASIYSPCYSRFDSAGNYYISECGGNRIRKVITVTTDIPTAAPSITPTTYYPSLSPHSISIITTIAGTGSTNYNGDGGQATSAGIGYPHGVDIDSSGNVYFNDYVNSRVRKVTVSTGIITTYAGTGSASYSGDGGIASSASLHWPHGLCIDSSGTNRFMSVIVVTILVLFIHFL